MNPSDDIRALHLREVTIHEVCHAFTELPRSKAVMVTLNLNPFYSFLKHHKVWDGQVKALVLNEDKYQDSVYGWAGIMGEAIELDREKAFELAWQRYQNDRQTVSESDLARIESVAPELRLKSAKTAYETLLGNWDEIKDIQTRAIKRIERGKLGGLGFGWIKGDGWVGLEEKS